MDLSYLRVNEHGKLFDGDINNDSIWVVYGVEGFTLYGKLMYEFVYVNDLTSLF